MKKKKVEKENWRKKMKNNARGRFWKVESRENKKGGDGIYGYTCVVEKNQEKKKGKRETYG